MRLDPLVEPPGDVQVDRQRQAGSRRQHAIEARIGGIRVEAGPREQHADPHRAGRALPVGDDVGDGRIGGIDGLDEREPAGMAFVHLERIARVVAVHRERRHQDRAIDADGVHRGHHLVARHLRGPDQHAVPRPPGVIARRRSCTCASMVTMMWPSRLGFCRPRALATGGAAFTMDRRNAGSCGEADCRRDRENCPGIVKAKSTQKISARETRRR